MLPRRLLTSSVPSARNFSIGTTMLAANTMIARSGDPFFHNSTTPLMMVLSSMSLRLAVRMIGTTLAGMYMMKAAISSAHVRE